ncbi:MAG: RNA polymerase sigma-70 factor (ECF subfamily) [Candidatus Azotimanducaceae bacterium]|jgi:RNA polymerase sigma-70 factor (ECF subfamily)
MATNVAFEILYREYYVRVFGLCRRLLTSPPMAEDATQETFMRAYRSFEKYDTSQPFWQWIASIANNHCIDVLRRQKKTNNLFGEEKLETIEPWPQEHPLLTEVITGQESHHLTEAINALPDKYRIPLVLAYFYDASYERIAAELSISTSHVGVLILRAKHRLREKLGDNSELAP